MTDRWVVPWLMLLVDGSIRWGIVLAALAAWFALRPPKRAATRHLLCISALAAGVILPFTPRWGVAVPSWYVPSPTAVEVPPEPTAPRPSPEPEASTRTVVEAASDAPHSPPREPGSLPAPPVIQAPPRNAAPIDYGRIVALAAAVAWAVIVVVLMARLAGGALVLARLRRGAVDGDEDARRLVDECRGRLGTRRPLRFAMHPGVASPVVLGGFRPLILAPTDWAEWPEPQRRACLLHELAHLARYDDWSKLAQELIRVPFFFHPLALWLFARLDRERELLCDEAVVALGTDPSSLVRLLVDLAKRRSRLSPAARPALLPFLDRRTVLVRIERLMEDDMPRTLSRPSLVRSLLFGSISLAACLAIGGFYISGEAKPTEEPNVTVKTRRPAAKKVTAPQGLSFISGKAVDMAAVVKSPGLVLDPEGNPVPGARYATGFLDPGSEGVGSGDVDDEGRFNPRAKESDVLALVWKDGVGAAAFVLKKNDPIDFRVHLSPPLSRRAVIVDANGAPIAGGKVRVTALRVASLKTKPGEAANLPDDLIPTPNMLARYDGSEWQYFKATTGDDGAFTLSLPTAVKGVKLEVEAPNGRVLRVGPGPEAGAGDRFVLDSPDDSPRLFATPAARIKGRVVTKMPDVKIPGLYVYYKRSVSAAQSDPTTNPGGYREIKADGEFVFDGLDAGTVDLALLGLGSNDEWTYRPAKGIKLEDDETAEVTFDLIPGVEIEGMVAARGTGEPVEGATLNVFGSVAPDAARPWSLVTTSAGGKYYCRLPAGEGHLAILELPSGFERLPDGGSTLSLAIPEGVDFFDAPRIEVLGEPTVHGRIVDATGSPIAGVRLFGVFESGNVQEFGQPTGAKALETDAQGAFRLPPSSADFVKVGEPVRLSVGMGGAGTEEGFEAVAIPLNDGSVVAQLPLVGKPPGGVEGPLDVVPGELAALVVDSEGRPVENADVSARGTSASGRDMVVKKTNTDARGVFRLVLEGLAKPPRGPLVVVEISKPGKTPGRFLQQPLGRSGWVVVLSDATYIEGKATTPDGKPVAGALVRANCGPKRAGWGYWHHDFWTEAKTDEDGHYRLYTPSDVYDVQVRVPGVGRALSPRQTLAPGEGKRLDLALAPGTTFRARLVDATTGAPLPGIRLSSWRYPDVEARSDDKGEVTVPDMQPGDFMFVVDAPGYARTWSDQAAKQSSRRYVDVRYGGWQNNTGKGVEFEMQPGMPMATILLERAVTLSGRVVDPDGKPFAGANVALNLIVPDGKGRSYDGHTIYESKVKSGGDGTFRIAVGASNDAKYNLVAHDGEEHERRTWASGVLPSMQTKPGDVIDGLEIRLNRPATIRGRIVYHDGVPAPGHSIRASSADRLDNQSHAHFVENGRDGVFELNFLRPGEQVLEVNPFTSGGIGIVIDRATKTVTVGPGEVKEGVELRIRSPRHPGTDRKAAQGN